MSFLDNIKNNLNEVKNQVKGGNENQVKKSNQLGLEIKLEGMDDFKPLGKSQYNRAYLDDIGPRLLIIIDEAAELLEPSGVKSTEGKEEDALKGELVGLIKSITQLGRSSGIHCVIATQRNDASIIPGVIQNNPFYLNSKIKVLRPKNRSEK